MKLPDHRESYNPPAEYLMTPEEEKEWKKKNSIDRAINFLPRKYIQNFFNTIFYYFKKI